jgi:PAS domain S-box-containing protein
MNKLLKLLNIEDSELDTELLVRHLKKEGYTLEYKRVDNLEQLEKTLAEDNWDIIISDYSMPGFSVDEALRFVKKTDLDIPFIVISGTIGEEKAVQVMRAGASDYLMKENLKRLAPAIEREMQEAENRRRKRHSEESLKESEKRLKLALAAAKMGVWEWNLQTDEFYWSPECFEIWGNVDFHGKLEDFVRIIHPNDVEVTMKSVEEAIAEHKGFEKDFRVIRADSQVIWISNLAHADYNENGVPVRIVGIAQDITERKAAEQQLKQSVERFEALASSAQLVWTSNANGYVLNPNSPLDQDEIAKLSESEFYWWLDTIHPDERELTLEKWKNSVETKEIYENENRILYKNREYYYYIRAVPVFNEDGGVREWVGMNLDITERKLAELAFHKSEEKLMQSQKLESVGRLAGGIAHDFNNMLTAINGYSDLALRKLSSNDPLRHYIEEIKKSGERSASLTQQLLAFSRKQVLNPKVIDVNNVIVETGSMLKRLIGEDIHFESMLSEDVQRIKVDVGQLSQVLMNLVVNARDAMPEGGSLTIETANVEFDERFSALHFEAKPGRYVMLAVSDTGIGMSEEVRKKIFEPFFSTKEVNKGTGLGLSTVYGIVKQSGGYIWVYSEPDKGSTFKVYFPQIEEEVKPIVERESHPTFKWGNETILLAEDEDMVRNLCRQVLESCGYKVVEAKNGVEALELFKNNQTKIDLLMTDIVMPKMGGRDLAENLQKLFPDLPVLFMSGYPDDAVIRHGIIDADMNYLQKPFTFNDLTKKVRDLLDN